MRTLFLIILLLLSNGVTYGEEAPTFLAVVSVEPTKGPFPRKWESVSTFTQRLKVYGGWIVSTTRALTFVPDPYHEWEIK